jgi:hypothetical protein
MVPGLASWLLDTESLVYLIVNEGKVTSTNSFAWIVATDMKSPKGRKPFSHTGQLV